MRLDVIFKIHHVVVGIGAREGEDISVLAVNLNPSSSHVNGLHTESGDGHNGDDGKHKGENQPLVLAKNEQVVVEVGFARGELKGRKAGLHGNQLNGAIGTIFAGYEFVFVSQF